MSTQEGLSNDVTLPVMEDHEGALWIGTNGGGINRVKDGRVTTFTKAQGLSDNLVFSIAEDGAGTIWVATQKGLDQFKQGRFVPYDRGGLPRAVIVCLYRDRKGGLWAGSRGGLSRFDGHHFETFTTEDGLSSNFVVALYEDAKHVMWIGTNGGLNKLEAGKFSSYTTKDGLSSDAVWSLLGDENGTLWIGTAGGGLNRFQDGKFRAYTTVDGLLDDEIYEILDDRHGFLWMSSNKGVFRVKKAELQRDRPAGGFPIRSFGIADGFRNPECNGGFQPAGWRTHDGRMVFPTMKGVAIVDPLHLEMNLAAPPVSIEGIAADGILFDGRTEIHAPPGRGQLQFNFTALSLAAAEKTTFKYQLEGFDREWTSAGERRVAYYTNIPPGNYRFRVTAANSDGIWSESGASVNVALRAHFYQTWWFVSLCAAAVLALCVALYRLRIRQLEERETRLMRVVDERTYALREQVEAKEKAHAELENAQQRLMELSRRSGMAEVATGVLHNVGNVLNSVNVGASVISGKLRDSRLEHLQSAVKLLDDHSDRLTQFVSEDAKGQRLIPYLTNLAVHLQSERTTVLEELQNLSSHIDHIKDIVSTQQEYAKVSTIVNLVSLPKLVDDAVRMVMPSVHRDEIQILRDIRPVPDVLAAKHKILEILVNLLQNAAQAIVEQNGPQRTISIRVRREGEAVRVEVKDTGTGLAGENLTRVFGHGFTTKLKGHGFGLHSGAIAAKQMNAALWAESEGIGRGATFILELPLPTASESEIAATGPRERD
jgi:signal transduction histidine kinase